MVSYIGLYNTIGDELRQIHLYLTNFAMYREKKRLIWSDEDITRMVSYTGLKKTVHDESRQIHCFCTSIAMFNRSVSWGLPACWVRGLMKSKL
jgi:predicted hydrolase (HD superfamily)